MEELVCSMKSDKNDQEKPKTKLTLLCLLIAVKMERALWKLMSPEDLTREQKASNYETLEESEVSNNKAGLDGLGMAII